MINFQLSTHDRNKTEERKQKKSQLEINQNEFIAKILQIDCKFHQLQKWHETNKRRGNLPLWARTRYLPSIVDDVLLR